MVIHNLFIDGILREARVNLQGVQLTTMQMLLFANDIGMVTEKKDYVHAVKPE